MRSEPTRAGLDNSVDVERSSLDTVEATAGGWSFRLEVRPVQGATATRLNTRIGEAVVALLLWAQTRAQDTDADPDSADDEASAA